MEGRKGEVKEGGEGAKRGREEEERIQLDRSLK